MRETLGRLLQMARLDDERGRLEEELAAIPTRRAALEAERDVARARLEEERVRLAATERRQRQLEGELGDAETQLARLDAQQYEVTSHDAYQALRREMTTLRETASARETETLELMEAIEAAQATVREHEAELAREEARVAEELREQESLAERLTKEVSRLQAARDEIAGRVAPDVLAPYERVASRRRPAAVAVSSEVCPGCRVGIPPQSYLEVLSGSQLVTCGTCHRILVHEGLVEG